MKEAEQLPYRELLHHPETLNSGSVIARMIDGLGFRYYWATEGLAASDLGFKPSPEARTSLETLEHLFVLSETLMNVASDQANIRPRPAVEMEFELMRERTLMNFKESSDIFSVASEERIANFEVVFQRGEKEYRYPIWHLLNGQLADALWHVGQIVSFRRTSGNPLPRGVDVFLGKKRD